MNPPISRHVPRTGLYAITPDENDTERLLARVETVLAAGAAWLQYRNKAADPALRDQQARQLLPLCRHHGVPLIINDDWRLAASIGADGAHLGEDDGELAAARATLPEGAILGASCYADLSLAHRAAAAGADYVAFGAFFPSPTKPDARRAGLDLLRDSAPLGLPRVVIGGITPDNARPLVAAGADLLAVISGVFDAADPAAAVRRYMACFELPSPHPSSDSGRGSQETPP
ncbi:thiamine phosphate synthase [Lysobacter sp. S4-A87]|uniref:thiamine phosphate synthase n=1 Tax=Lysobacter sp. S4-A87 TaxID=2925843 RepID=UPI001F532618|nr:thiamine phosphate synthase [Lysobacter sp. S4-A87]UNK50951.1 thiamine phosphate synthase [Lysobacter sp. S4-A87]